MLPEWLNLITAFPPHFILGLSSISGIGRRTLILILKELLTFSRTIPQDIWVSDLTKFHLKCISNKQLEAIQKFSFEYTSDSFINWLKTHHTFGIVIGQKTYPHQLLALENPPFVLYITQKNIWNSDGLKLPFNQNVILFQSVVGTRHPSFKGRIAAERIGWKMAQTGHWVVSGCMYGIDAITQQSTLEAGGSTLGILGHGWETHISERGRAQFGNWFAAGVWFISEWPPGTLPLPGLFIQRNRLIAALGVTTLVVEAGELSGSWHTAKAAQTLHKPVYLLADLTRNPPHDFCGQSIELNQYLHDLNILGSGFSKPKTNQFQLPDSLKKVDLVVKQSLSTKLCSLAELQAKLVENQVAQNQLHLETSTVTQPSIKPLISPTQLLAYLQWLQTKRLVKNLGDYWYAVGEW